MLTNFVQINTNNIFWSMIIESTYIFIINTKSLSFDINFFYFIIYLEQKLNMYSCFTFTIIWTIIIIAKPDLFPVISSYFRHFFFIS